MTGKKVWVTWMPSGQGAPGPDVVLGALGAAGLDVGGTLWVDDLGKMAWYELGSAISEKDKADCWLVAGRGEDFKSRSNRYGLSLATAMVSEGRGPAFPVFFLGLDQPLDTDAMPTLLRTHRFLSASDSGWPAKIATVFIKPARPAPFDFRISAVGHPIIGQWVEIGPREEEWAGAMFGVSSEGMITHHMVGPKGQLPDKSVLEYATEGIEAEVGGAKYIAWSVQNKIGPGDSYYVKFEGQPQSLLIGGHPGTDQAEVTIVKMW